MDYIPISLPHFHRRGVQCSKYADLQKWRPLGTNYPAQRHFDGWSMYCRTCP